MAGYRFVVSGDPSIARNTVYSALQQQGFTVMSTGDWSAEAERGSQGASIGLGAFAGKKGRHVRFSVACWDAGDGNLAVTLIEGTSGWSGGIIGATQANSVYREVYTNLGSTFQGAGVFVSGEAV